MKCPVCKDDTLQAVTLEQNLPAQRCAQCGGVWLASNDYRNWRRVQAGDLPERTLAEASAPALDTQELKLCPTCGRFMTRYRVLANGDLRLDRCGHCNGVWLDKGEWEALVARNLHDNVNEFFTKPWQLRLQAEQTKAMLDKLYRERLGAEAYDKIREVDAWLRQQPQRAMLLAFLQAEDPYKI